jgi:dihydrolipoamide dehydrogenase
VVTQYDVVVIGAGPGGYVAAIHAAQSGLKTAIVERDGTERLGGTCLLRGCIPTKALLHTADVAEEIRHSESIGLITEGVEVSMEKVHAYKDKIVTKNARGVSYLMKKNEVEVHFGHGRLAGKGKIRVEAADGKSTTLETKHVILATGSRCRHLPFISMEHARVMDSDELLELREIPKHLVVIGAGAVGMEFASVFLRYGSEITVVEYLDQVLPAEDAEVSKAAAKSFKRQGMKLLTSSKVTDVTATDEGVQVVVEAAAGGSSQVIEASHLLVAVGRAPVTQDIGAEGTELSIDEGGVIAVDEYMRTGEEGVYAIGDITDSPWLAHVASKEGILAVDHIAGKDPRPINYDLVPMCTYCSPEVASVGLTEAKAKERGYDVKTGVFPFSALGKAAILNQTEGFVKIVSEAKYDEILGLHIIGPKATELITEGTLAMELECTLAELLQTIHPHPTLAEAVAEAAHAATGHAIHI